MNIPSLMFDKEGNAQCRVASREAGTVTSAYEVRTDSSSSILLKRHAINLGLPQRCDDGYQCCRHEKQDCDESHDRITKGIWTRLIDGGYDGISL